MKILTLLISFSRELIFDSKEEHTFSHHNFNPRKFVVFALIILLFCLTIFFGERTFSSVGKIIELQERIEILECQLEGKKNCIGKK